ncbi:MAG: alpha/beta hydrolase [Deltaproteobacteria bacterium]|nr:alpha/beta hydrolase [Deltaproteobacteria bacterium]
MSDALRFDDEGQGEPLLLLHAFPFDRTFWSGVTPLFVKAGLRVIAPDLMGFGQSPGKGPWSIVDQAEAVSGLLQSLGIRKATVLGLSMGGYIALALINRHPEQVKALVLADTKATADSAQALQGRANAIKTVQEQGVGAFADGMVEKLLAPTASASVRALTRSLMNQPQPGVLAALAALRDRPDRSQELANIRVSTLVVVGEHDLIATPAEGQQMAAALPYGSFTKIAGAGHLTNLEAPDKFVSAVLDFLETSAR